jgi:hypothetical protein
VLKSEAWFFNLRSVVCPSNDLGVMNMIYLTSMMHANTQQRQKLGPPSLPRPLRGRMGKLHERKDRATTRTLCRLPLATQQLKSEQKGVASETNLCSMG